MPREDRATEVAEQRRTRIPMGGDRLVLDAKPRPGYVARYVLDNPGRIRRLEDAGYQKARPEDYGGASSTDLGSSTISVGAGGRAGRTDARLILMEQKQEFYDEDQAAKAAVVQETERKVAAGKPEGEGASRDNMQYVPDRGISLQRR